MLNITSAKCLFPGNSKGGPLKLLTFILCVLAFVPFFLAARYAVFSGDDFSFYNSVQALDGSTYFIRCLQDAVITYMTWQGTYLANLINNFFNPLQWYSYAVLRLTLMALLLLSFFSLLFLSREADKYFGLGGKTVYIFALLLLPMLLYRDYSAVYLWYIGAMAYQVPVIFLILGFAFLLRGKRKNNSKLSFLAGACFFLVGGGPLNIGGVTAWFLLLLLICDFLTNKKIDKTFLIMFLVIFVGDLINVLAPGNYARSGELQIVAAVVSSLTVFGEEFIWLVFKNGFFIFVFLAFFIGLSVVSKISGRTLSLLVIGLLFTPFIALFPYMLGYSLADASLELISHNSRTMLVLDGSIVIGLEVSAFFFGSWLSSLFRLSEKGNVFSGRFRKASILVLVFAALVISVNSLPIRIMHNLQEGKVEEYSVGWREIYDLLRDSPGEDIVLVNMPESCEGTYHVSYGAYPSHAANMDWCEYFGTNSVCHAWYISSQKNSVTE